MIRYPKLRVLKSKELLDKTYFHPVNELSQEEVIWFRRESFSATLYHPELRNLFEVPFQEVCSYFGLNILEFANKMNNFRIFLFLSFKPLYILIPIFIQNVQLVYTKNRSILKLLLHKFDFSEKSQKTKAKICA